MNTAPPIGEPMLIAFVDAWYVVDKDMRVLSGPHDTHEDAQNAAKTRAYRIAQGWKP